MKTILAVLLFFAAALVLAPRAAAQSCLSTYNQAHDVANELYWLTQPSDRDNVHALARSMSDAATLVSDDETAYAASLCSAATLADLRALTARLQAKLAQMRAQHLADRIANLQTAVAAALRNPLFR